MKFFTDEQYVSHINCILINYDVTKFLLDEFKKCKSRNFAMWTEEEYKKYNRMLCGRLIEHLKNIEKNDKVVYEVILSLYANEIDEICNYGIKDFKHELGLDVEP